MRKFFLLSLALVVSASVWSQSSRRLVTPLTVPLAIGPNSEAARLPFPDLDPFFTYFVEWPEGSLDVRIRFSADGSQWTDWQPLRQDEHSEEKGSTLLYVGDSHHRYYQVRAEGRPLADANLHFFHPGPTAAAIEPTEGEARDLLACPCPQPEYQSRSQWCPSGNCPIRGAPVNTAVTHLIVHHTAGPNELSDWAAYMRAVWDFHVNGRGWDDIGYNWLVDPNGVIYQGRGDNVRGAHFCGNNTGTMGVAMMGDFTDREPTLAAITALQTLLAWKSCDRNFDPLTTAFHASSGQNLRRISGHRDGCATSCPGDQFYPLFGELRQAVDSYIENNCTYTGPLVLSSTSLNDSTFQLNWVYTGDATLDSFYLEKAVGESPQPFGLYQTLPALVNTFTEADLELDGIFRYRLRGLTTDGDTTDFSNTLLINTTIVGQNPLQLATTAIRVTPNPLSDQAVVRLQTADDGDVHLELINAAGQVRWRQRSHKHGPVWTQAVDWSGVPAGLYFLRVRLGERYGIQRVVKTK